MSKAKLNSTSRRFLVRQTVGIYWSAARRYPMWLALHTPCVLTGVGLQNILTPWLIAQGIQAMPGYLAHPTNFGGTFGWIIAGYALSQFGAWSAWRISGLAEVNLELKVIRDLEQRCFAHLTTLSYHFFANSFGGALVAKVNRFVSAFERLYDTVSFDILPLLLKLFLSIAIILTFSPIIAGVMLLFSVAFSILTIGLFRWKSPAAKEAAAAQSDLTARLADDLANASAIKYFARESDEITGFNAISQRKFKASFRDWGLSEIAYAIQAFLLLGCEGSIFVTALYLIAHHRIGLGQFVLVQAYVWNVFGSLWNVGRMVRNTERSLADAVEMTEVLLTRPGVRDATPGAAVRIADGAVTLRDVRFGYHEGRKTQPVFKQLSLEIRPGEKVGLVGPSGGGKTTLTKLLLRLMDVDGGQILLDGHDIAAMPQANVRRAVSYVPQEPLLFHRSLRENIAYGQPSATKQQILQAARRAHAAEFIDRLPQGYDTPVGERGIKLSGGQRQRVAIARAMLKNAPILVLDEATSALDSESERLIQEALWELMEGRTAIVVAHRLSTIQRLDRIVVLADGGVVEQGSHAELLAAGGMYARLWARQSGGFLDEDQGEAV